MALHCYIDESESKSAVDPCVTVAGYIAQGKRWERFSKDWNKALDNCGPNRVEVCHATNFAGGRGRDYQGWRKADFDNLLNGLIATVKAYNLVEMGAAIHRSVYKEVMTGRRGRIHGDIYVIAGKVTMMKVAAWARVRGWRYAPSFFVESGSCYFEALREAHRQLRRTPGFEEFFSLSGFSEVPKSREYPQTQPADLLTFYSSRWMSQWSGFDPTKESEQSFIVRKKLQPVNELMELLPGPEHNLIYQTSPTLENVLKALEADFKREEWN